MRIFFIVLACVTMSLLVYTWTAQNLFWDAVEEEQVQVPKAPQHVHGKHCMMKHAATSELPAGEPSPETQVLLEENFERPRTEPPFMSSGSAQPAPVTQQHFVPLKSAERLPQAVAETQPFAHSRIFWPDNNRHKPRPHSHFIPKSAAEERAIQRRAILKQYMREVRQRIRERKLAAQLYISEEGRQVERVAAQWYEVLQAQYLLAKRRLLAQQEAHRRLSRAAVQE